MVDSKPTRNAKYLGNAQLSSVSSPKNHPLDSPKTLCFFSVDARIKLRSSPELTARLEAAAKPVMGIAPRELIYGNSIILLKLSTLSYTAT